MIDLNELFNRVGLASGPDRGLDADLCRALDKKSWDKYRNWASMPCGAPEEVIERDAERWADHHTSSVDSALYLTTLALPGWKRQLLEKRGGAGWVARVSSPTYDTFSSGEDDPRPNASLAILLALLKALIAKESENDQ